MTDWTEIFTGLFFHAYDTPSEKTGLSQLPIVSTAFNKFIHQCLVMWNQFGHKKF